MSFDSQDSVSTGTGTIDLTDSAAASEPIGSSGYVCGTTGTAGNVAFEVGESGAPQADILGWFVPEHIFRDVVIPALGQTAPVSSTTPPTVIPADKVVLQSGSNGGGGSSSTGASTTTTSGGAATTPVTPLSVSKGNSCKVNSIHLYAKRGYAQLKVSCTQSKTDSIVVRAYRANGKLIKSYRKSVASGKTVTVYLNTKKAAHVTVSV
jgi:hypothetical protein